MQELMVAWKTGQHIDEDCFSSTDEEIVQDLYDMIIIWDRTERHSNYFHLGMMIGGDPDDNKSNK